MSAGVSMGVRESDIEAAIIEALALLKCTVKHTSAKRQKNSSGVSHGIADLIVFHGSIPRGMAIHMEVKKLEGWRWSSPEQRRAYMNNEFHLVHSVDDAVLVMYEHCIRSRSGAVHIAIACSKLIRTVRASFPAVHDRFVEKWGEPE